MSQGEKKEGLRKEGNEGKVKGGEEMRLLKGKGGIAGKVRKKVRKSTKKRVERKYEEEAETRERWRRGGREMSH